MKDLANELKNEDLSSNYLDNTVDENWTKLEDTLFSNMNKSIPTSLLKNKQDIPWLHKDTKRMLRKKKTTVQTRTEK